MSADVGLIRYDHMCTAIAECHRVDEVKELRNKAKALEVYAKQAQNVEAERKCCEVRIRAERRAGELLRDMKETGQRDSGSGGDRKSHSRSTRVIGGPDDVVIVVNPTTLSNLGITYDQSAKWQQLAEVPLEDFEKAVKGDGPKPSTEGIINANILRGNPAPSMDLDSLWAWGRILDFEQKGVLDRDAGALLAAMTDPMREDCLRIIPRLRAWLQAMVKGNDGKNIRAA